MDDQKKNSLTYIIDEFYSVTNLQNDDCESDFHKIPELRMTE